MVSNRSLDTLVSGSQPELTRRIYDPVGVFTGRHHGRSACWLCTKAKKACCDYARSGWKEDEDGFLARCCSGYERVVEREKR